MICCVCQKKTFETCKKTQSNWISLFWTPMKYSEPPLDLWSENKMTFSNMVDIYFINELFEIWSSFNFGVSF